MTVSNLSADLTFDDRNG